MIRWAHFQLYCIGILVILSVVPAFAAADTEFDVRQNFPHHLQGENGIYLQYRSGSNYVDLINYNPWTSAFTDSVFVNPDLTDPDFFPTILGYEYFNPTPSPNQISAAPSCTPRNNLDADTVLRVTIPDTGGTVRITGSYGITPNPDVDNTLFYIYLGEDQYSAPLWSGGGSGSIDLTVPYSNGDRVFFATQAGDDCRGNDLAFWRDLKLTTEGSISVSEFPSLVFPLAVITGLLGTVFLIQRMKD